MSRVKVLEATSCLSLGRTLRGRGNCLGLGKGGANGHPHGGGQQFCCSVEPDSDTE